MSRATSKSGAATQDVLQRLAALESDVARLKSTRGGPRKPMGKWWHEIAGAFDSDPVYAEICREGEKWRRLQRSGNGKSAAPKKAGVGRAHS